MYCFVEESTSQLPVHKERLLLYLQIQEETKRVVYTGEMSLAALRMLFLETFNFNPGQDDFPKIYVHDAKNKIYYDLQDPAGLQDGSVLKLWSDCKGR